MEERIRNYEKFIKQKIKEAESSGGAAAGKFDPKLVTYHREMMSNFQHERLIHLIITLFFVTLSLGALTFSGILTGEILAGGFKGDFMTGTLMPSIPVFILTIVVVVLTIFYVKHYYFLENHIQKLYDASKEISGV